MTLKVEIPKDIEAELLAAARAKGISPESYAAELFGERLTDTARDSGRGFQTAHRQKEPSSAIYRVSVEGSLSEI